MYEEVLSKRGFALNEILSLDSRRQKKRKKRKAKNQVEKKLNSSLIEYEQGELFKRFKEFDKYIKNFN